MDKIRQITADDRQRQQEVGNHQSGKNFELELLGKPWYKPNSK
jgi:hypothetical protein